MLKTILNFSETIEHNFPSILQLTLQDFHGYGNTIANNHSKSYFFFLSRVISG